MTHLEEQLERIRALHESSRTIAELLAMQGIGALVIPYAKEVAELRNWITQHRPELAIELRDQHMTVVREILNRETRLTFQNDDKVGPACVAYLEALKVQQISVGSDPKSNS